MSDNEKFEDFLEEFKKMLFPQYSEIPKEFYNSETNAPFAECIKCKKAFESETRYVIQKQFEPDINGDTVAYFEYAMCYECSYEDAEGPELSAISKIRIDEFFEELMDSEAFDKLFGWYGRLQKMFP